MLDIYIICAIIYSRTKRGGLHMISGMIHFYQELFDNIPFDDMKSALGWVVADSGDDPTEPYVIERKAFLTAPYDIVIELKADGPRTTSAQAIAERALTKLINDMGDRLGTYRIRLVVYIGNEEGAAEHPSPEQ